MNFRKILVLGGARSGKSRLAQKLVERSGFPRIFIATAEAQDSEMAERIARHQAERGAGWETHEVPLALPDVIRAQARENAVLIDCLTLWLSNVMLAGRDADDAVEELAHAVRQAQCRLVLVSNEIGLGLVPDTPLGRVFRDAQGRLNQKIVDACNAAIVMIAGCPLLLKPRSDADIALG